MYDFKFDVKEIGIMLQALSARSCQLGSCQFDAQVDGGYDSPDYIYYAKLKEQTDDVIRKLNEAVYCK